MDEIALNKALFDKEGVEVIGAVLNKVEPEKMRGSRRGAEGACHPRDFTTRRVTTSAPTSSRSAPMSASSNGSPHSSSRES